MKQLSSTQAYAEVEFKKSEKAFFWTYAKRMLNELNEYNVYLTYR